MLVIRLFRVGKKNQPSFKIVVTDKKNPPKSGRFVEQVGFYNSRTKEKNLKQERIKYWLGVGAQPSPTLHNLLVTEKIIEGKKIPLHKKSKKPAEASPVATPATPEAPAPVATAKPTEEKSDEVKEEAKAEAPIEEKK